MLGAHPRKDDHGDTAAEFAEHGIAGGLATWYRLERAAVGPSLDVVMDSTRQKVEAIEKAQRDGLVPTGTRRAELLALVVHLSTLWHSTTPDMATITEGLSREQRRRVVTTVVAALPRD